MLHHFYVRFYIKIKGEPEIVQALLSASRQLLMNFIVLNATEGAFV